MHVKTLGDRRPEYTVVTCVHGDESCGGHAFNRLKASEVSQKAPRKFVLANERAFKLGYRYCDPDLNRIMPGDSESDRHEQRLVARLHRELERRKVLNTHSTESTGCPFAIMTGGDVFAKKDGTARQAEEAFYPVLMSTDGYEDRIGFRAQRVDFTDATT